MRGKYWHCIWNLKEAVYAEGNSGVRSLEFEF